jgi:hypothetical protein
LFELKGEEGNQCSQIDHLKTIVICRNGADKRDVESTVAEAFAELTPKQLDEERFEVSHDCKNERN